MPKPNSVIKFSIERAFKRKNGTFRKWLTYSDKRKALFCTVCLAFAKPDEASSFIRGMSDWNHTYQRIEQHEKSAMHGKCSELYFMHTQQKTIGKLLFSSQLDLRNKQVMNRRQVLDRVINVIKLIGKRGLSFRRNENEAAYSLLDETLDHGTFLEIILLLSKYDIILKEHVDIVAVQSQQMHDKGHKHHAGSFVTFLSKTTINSIIMILSKMLKKRISLEVNKANMYSIEIDTTQDISVEDQCSIVVVRYVHEDTVCEKLLSVTPCHDTTGEGFFNLLVKELQENNLNISNCVADSTDGADNMQGEYKGLVAKIRNENSNHVHIWCYIIY